VAFRIGLSLNQGKCEIYAINIRPRITFRDGTRLKQVDEVKYLGTYITAVGQGWLELRRKIGRTWTLAKQLKSVYRKARISNKWKMQTATAMLDSVMMYALESVYLTPAARRKLNGTQMALYRYVLNIKPPHISRISNATVWQKVKNAMPTKKQWATLWEDRTVTLLGHILRAPDTDPLRKVIAQTDGRFRINAYKRVGRPCFTWIKDTAERAAAKIGTPHNDYREPICFATLLQAASERRF
jgi:ribosomal 50S subunit-associated protein YjgA (DUF615 family)